MGNFSNASLNGQYAYQLSGTDLFNGNVPFREEGAFTADGAGHITGGEDDFVEGTGGPLTTTVSGSYSISNDGTATTILNFSDGTSITLAMTLASSSKVYLVEADTVATAAGVAEKQNAAVLTSVPSGTFAFRMHTSDGSLGSAGSTGSVGVFTISSGITSGSEDVSDGGVASSRTITSGLFNTPDSNGRGTGTLTDSSLNTSSLVYYVVDANNIRLLTSTPGILGLGRAEKQTGAPFAVTSLSGNYAFGGNGDTPVNVGGLRAVGQFMADGSGTIPSGALDAVQDGTTATNASITGTYSVDATTGRAPVALTGGLLTNEVLYLVSPSRAFFLVTDPGTVAEGTLDLQSSSSFTNASMNGQFAFLMDGFNTSFFIDRVATLNWDGAGALSLNELVNASGTINVPGILTGTYSVGSNGRTTGTITNLSNNMVFYLVSGSKAYILQNDTATEIDGMTELQQ
jgi:hypothetical protein